MAHGLEGRTPFLDPQVAAFAFPLADKFKIGLTLLSDKTQQAKANRPEPAAT